MFDQVDARVLFNEYLMTRSQDPRPWILVEGDDECHLLDRHLNTQVLRTIPAQGKLNVLGAIPLFDTHGALDVMFLMDADFGPITGFPIIGHPRVVYTDAYDIEAELLLAHPDISRALIYTYARKHGLASLDDTQIAQLWDEACQLSTAVGAARLASITGRLGLGTSDLPFPPLVRVHAKGSVLATLIRIIASKSGVTIAQSGLSISNLRQLAATHGAGLICGHDLIASIAAVLRSLGRRAVAEGSVKDSFHALADCRKIASGSWLGPIVGWAAQLGHTDAFLCSQRAAEGGC